MKRILAAAVSILFIGGSPALAADGLVGIGPVPWAGYGHDPLWAWDDGFFRDLKYRHDRYGYRPYRHGPSGEVDVVHGEARYYYDRGYPYDHYDYGRGGYDREPGFYNESASVSCRTQWVWSDRDREEVSVRICS